MALYVVQMQVLSLRRKEQAADGHQRPNGEDYGWREPEILFLDLGNNGIL